MAAAQEVAVPDIGDFSEVEVIEVLVSPGDKVSAEDPLITIESDKASMEIPSSASGVIDELKVKVGDKVSEGSTIVTLTGEASGGAEAAEGDAKKESEASAASGDAAEETDSEATPEPATESQGGGTEAPATEPPASAASSAPSTEESPQPRHVGDEPPPPPAEQAKGSLPHASPGVRRFARELGVTLDEVRGSGPKGRILKDDVQAFVKDRMQAGGAGQAAGPGLALPEAPAVDFSQYGEIETQALSRIQKRSGPNVHRNYVTIPHVTQHDHADITELEAFRKSLKDEAQAREVRLTLLAFMLKASVGALKAYPRFNASLSADGESLILKKYFHIGVAVDTPGGLVVPVIRDVDRKGIFELAEALGEVSGRARDGKLSPEDMRGGCFTISSLGGIGGTAFTPIINAPELAILGVSRASMQPVYRDGEFEPRLMLPLSLSYDHRVIDGAQAARFAGTLCEVLGDMRRLLL